VIEDPDRVGIAADAPAAIAAETVEIAVTAEAALMARPKSISTNS
jgi:hypothetical protein